MSTSEPTNAAELRVGRYVAFVDLMGFGAVTLDPAQAASAFHQLLDLNQGIDLLCQLDRFRGVHAYGFSDCAFVVFESFEEAVLFCSTLYQFCCSRKARLRGAITPGYGYDLRQHTDRTFRAPNFRPSPVCGSGFTLAAALEMKAKLKGFRLFSWRCVPSTGSRVLEVTRELEALHPAHRDVEVRVREVIWPTDYNANVVQELNRLVGGDSVMPAEEIWRRFTAEWEQLAAAAPESERLPHLDATLGTFTHWHDVVRPRAVPPAP